MATADTAVDSESASAIYQFQGTLLEACNCDVLCPCWIGEDPDNGTCSSVVAYHFDHGAAGAVVGSSPIQQGHRTSQLHASRSVPWNW